MTGANFKNIHQGSRICQPILWSYLHHSTYIVQKQVKRLTQIVSLPQLDGMALTASTYKVCELATSHNNQVEH